MTASARITWKRNKVLAPCGEYAKTMVVNHMSDDARFRIYPRGRMIYRRENGIRGPYSYRWSWGGFSMYDAVTHRTHSGSTVGWLKRTAERLQRRTA